MLDILIGLIDNSWEGTTVEGWIERDVLGAEGKSIELSERWDALAKPNGDEAATDRSRDQLTDWETTRAAKSAGPLRNLLVGNQRPFARPRPTHRGAGPRSLTTT